MTKNTWQAQAEKTRETPKFLRKDTTAIVMPDEPVRATVKGKFGDREMYIINTREYGKVYISALQLVKIVDAFAGDFSNPIMVIL